MAEDLQVKCVRPKDEPDSPTSALQEAFDLLREHDFSPVWVTQEECLQVEDANRNCYYVMDPFEGAAFEHLKLLGCRVYGPQCMLATLLMKIEIPRRKHPVYNLAMKEVVVSCTNMDHETRSKVHGLVELMGGQVSRALTEDVTHLVAGYVGSEKYLVAADRGKQIMTFDWVLNVWEKGKHRYVSAVDEQFLKFRCPVFKGLVVTVSGLGPDERKKVKHYIEAEGGRYSGEMKLGECTHLILKEPRGSKYEFAKKWKISIVTIKWLYESLDRNFCQNEKNYVVTGNSGDVKTSTPERSRKSAQIPNISDISAISAGLAHIDETAFQTTCMTTRMNDTTMDNLDMLDLSAATTASFLDSCRVYLSGVTGQALEKCKKIINAGGGTRFNAINENVTHVVIGEKCESDINALMNMEQRPHLVTPAWLAECFQRKQLVSEQPFMSPCLPAPDVRLPEIKIHKRKASAKGSEGRATGQSKADRGESTVSAAVSNGEGDEMAEILSQYLSDGTRTNVSQAADEVDGNASAVEQNRDHESDLTQGPQSQSMSTEGGVFSGKTFIFCGFTEEDCAALAEMVSQAGGRLLKERTRKVPDYAVVPLTGCPVEQTVGEVATNAWLQMCIESQTLLAVEGHPMFRPIRIDEAARPLENCVLSVSGYSGVERDCLIHLADLLGAACQEYFVRKATKALQASTHLIVKEASGSKYNAALKWNVPALSGEWLFACAKSGKREDEQKFHIDNISGALAAVETKSAPSKSDRPNANPPAETVGALNEGSATERQGGLPLSSKPDNGLVPVADGKLRESNGPPVTDAESTDLHDKGGTAPKRQRHTQSVSQLVDRVPASSAETVTSDSADKVPSSSASEGERTQARQAELPNPMSGAKAMLGKTSRHLSQKENMTTGVKGKGAVTPVVEKRVARSRVEELQQQSRKPVLSPGVDSPSVFLAPGFRPKFDLTGVFAYLKSPDVPQKDSERRESLSLEEVFQHHLALGVKNSSVKRDVDPLTYASQSQDEERGPLDGVIIAVSKKLSGNQMEYNSIVTELGGDYTWQSSEACTHFIFQGRANDMNKEFKQMKSQGKIIVSPHWLYACLEQNSRVDESMYPHNYNPNLNLGGVVKTDTPGSSRALRRSARKTPRPGQEDSQSAGAKTPSRALKQKAWQESMSQMQGWREAAKSAVTPKDSAKGSLEFVAENARPKRSPTDSADEKQARENSRSKRSSTESTDAKQVRESSKSTRSSMETAHEQHAQDGFSTSAFERSTTKRLCSDTETNGGKSAAAANSNQEAVVEVAAVQMEEQPKRTEEAADQAEGGVGGGCSPGLRDVLSKTLETYKATSSRSRRSGRRRSKRVDGSSSGDQLDISGNVPDAGHRASPWQQHQHHPAHAPVQDGHQVEASQSLQVTWDDPTCRREQERLAHKLERVGSPSQNTEDFMAQMEMPDFDLTTESAKAPSDAPTNKAPKLDRSPTPEPPPLAFPTAKNTSRLSAPQPVELLSDESCDDQSDSPKLPPVILISGMQQQERVEYSAVVEQLGGTVLDKQQFDPACTHLVVGQPTRNEKFLAAVATGRWVLHKSYFLACRQEGRFVREEDHEWGNPTMSSLLSNMNAQTNKLAAAAHKWRKRVQDMKKADPQCQGAYQGWRVILLTDKSKEDNFRRLLSAGGATVINVRPPFTEGLNATHAFVELHKVKLSESDMDMLVSGVTNVLKPEFIAAHLTDSPAPCPEEFTPPEVLALKNSLPDNVSRKRRATESSGSSGKRSRR